MTMQPAPSAPETRQIYRWTGALFDVLTQTKNRFGGDLDQYLLYMAFVQAQMARALNGRPGSAGLNALSAARTCGMPRETARGKLQRLIASGLLRVGQDGLYHLTGATAAQREYGLLSAIAAPVTGAERRRP